MRSLFISCSVQHSCGSCQALAAIPEPDALLQPCCMARACPSLCVSYCMVQGKPGRPLREPRLAHRETLHHWHVQPLGFFQPLPCRVVLLTLMGVLHSHPPLLSFESSIQIARVNTTSHYQPSKMGCEGEVP